MSKVIRFPVAQIAARLRSIHEMIRCYPRDQYESESGESGVDVRLAVYPDGGWVVTWGDVSYDSSMSHASGFIPHARRFDSLGCARALINEAADCVADDPEFPAIAYARSPAEVEYAKRLRVEELIHGKRAAHERADLSAHASAEFKRLTDM